MLPSPRLLLLECVSYSISHLQIAAESLHFFKEFRIFCTCSFAFSQKISAKNDYLTKERVHFSGQQTIRKFPLCFIFTTKLYFMPTGFIIFGQGRGTPSSAHAAPGSVRRCSFRAVLVRGGRQCGASNQMGHVQDEHLSPCSSSSPQVFNPNFDFLLIFKVSCAGGLERSSEG